jgi:hypothetical protein
MVRVDLKTADDKSVSYSSRPVSIRSNSSKPVLGANTESISEFCHRF